MRRFSPIFLSLAAGAVITAPAQTCGTHCGTERWPVKTMTDADRGKISFIPAITTVSQLRNLDAPPQRPDSARVSPTELTTFQIHAVLIGWKLEADQDMHLVIADPADPTRTMIAEVPSATCDHVCSSEEATEFQAARAALIARLGTPTSSFHRLAAPLPIVLTGVGFFDFLHGQTGVAPNGIELHPVLRVDF